MIVELAVLPGRTDHLEVRVRAIEEAGAGPAVLVARFAISDPGDGSFSAQAVASAEPLGAMSVLLRPRDAEMVAAAILEASRRALAIT